MYAVRLTEVCLLAGVAGAHHQADLVQPPQHLQGCWRGEEGLPLLQALNQGFGL